MQAMEKGSEKSRILYNIFYVVFRRKWALISICIIAYLLILFLTFLKTPKYKATAKILVRTLPQQQLILFRDLATPGQEFARVNPAANLIQILTSQAIAQEIVQRFGLDERLRKKREEPAEIRDIIKRSIINVLKYPISKYQIIRSLEQVPPNHFADAVKELMEDAEDIQLEADTNVIILSIWEETPKLSSEIADYMAHRLIEKSTELEQANARDAYNFTKEQLQAAKIALEDSEDELNQFRKKNRIVNLDKQKQNKLDQLNMIERQFITASANLSVLREKLGEFKKKLRSNGRVSQNSSINSNNAVMRELLDSIESAEIEKGILKKQIKKLKAEAFSLTTIDTELGRLARRKETDESLYKNLLNKFSELGVQQASQMSGHDLKIIDKAYLPDNASPDSPKLILVIVLGLMGSLLMSFGAVFFVEYWNESFKSPNEIEDILQLPVLCTMPKVR
jgi:uncharacterized protein involved in exopolysaccharide biosynthesis